MAGVVALNTSWLVILTILAQIGRWFSVIGSMVVYQKCAGGDFDRA